MYEVSINYKKAVLVFNDADEGIEELRNQINISTLDEKESFQEIREDLKELKKNCYSEDQAKELLKKLTFLLTDPDLLTLLKKIPGKVDQWTKWKTDVESWRQDLEDLQELRKEMVRISES